MAYTKTNWNARQGTGLNKFTKSAETANSVVLANTPDAVTEPGTPFSAANMNKIEEGIFQAHEGVAAETQARERGDETLAQAISSLDKSDVGLGSVTDDAQVKRGEMGAADGVATLDGEGKVPLAQLPEFMSGEGDSEALARANAYTEEKVGEEARARREQLELKADAADVVKLVGDQAIEGIKTFSVSPVVPAKNAYAENNPTTLATEAQVSLLMRRGLPTQTYTVALAGLQTAIDSLPRLLNGNVTVNVQAGSLPNDTITIERFFGNGTLTVRAVDAAGAVVTAPAATHSVKNIAISYNAVPYIHVVGFRCVNNANSADPADRCIGGTNNVSRVFIELCTMNAAPSHADGVYFLYSRLINVTQCVIGNKAYCLRANQSDMVINGVTIQNNVSNAVFRASAGQIRIYALGSMPGAVSPGALYSSICGGVISMGNGLILQN
jgi:hypothetical protein